MEVIETILLVAATLLTLSWMFNIRSNVSAGRGTSRQTINTTMLFVFSIAFDVLVGWSSLNLLWMFPISFVLGTLSLVFPLSLLWIFGKYLALLCSIGLSQRKTSS